MLNKNEQLTETLLSDNFFMSTDIIYFNYDLLAMILNDFSEIRIENIIFDKNIDLDLAYKHYEYSYINSSGYRITTTTSSLKILKFFLVEIINKNNSLFLIEDKKFFINSFFNKEDKNNNLVIVNKNAHKKFKFLSTIGFDNNLNEHLMLKPEYTNYLFNQILFKSNEENLYSSFNLDITENIFYVIYINKMKTLFEDKKNKNFVIEPIAVIKI